MAAAHGYVVRLLTDHRATRSLITSAVRDAALAADPDGTILFFFSRHGFDCGSPQKQDMKSVIF